MTLLQMPGKFYLVKTQYLSSHSWQDYSFKITEMKNQKLISEVIFFIKKTKATFIRQIKVVKSDTASFFRKRQSSGSLWGLRIGPTLHVIHEEFMNSLRILICNTLVTVSHLLLKLREEITANTKSQITCFLDPAVTSCICALPFAL